MTNYRSEREYGLAAQDSDWEPERGWFNALSSCTGNCNQGRQCDCVADVPEGHVREPGLAVRFYAWVCRFWERM